MCRRVIKLDREVVYDTTNLNSEEREEFKKALKKDEGSQKRWLNGVYESYVYFEEGLWYQDYRKRSKTNIVDAKILFKDSTKKVIFEKPADVVYLEDINENFTKYNVGIKYVNGIKNILVAKNEREFYLVDEHIHLDMMACFDNIKDVVLENDEVLIFGTFVELLEWKAEK